MDIALEEAYKVLKKEVVDYCTKNYDGKPIDEIFALTAAEEYTAEDNRLKLFHQLCFRHVVDNYLYRMMVMVEDQKTEIHKLRLEMKKMAQVIDVLNQDGASK